MPPTLRQAVVAPIVSLLSAVNYMRWLCRYCDQVMYDTHWPLVQVLAWEYGRDPGPNTLDNCYEPSTSAALPPPPRADLTYLTHTLIITHNRISDQFSISIINCRIRNSGRRDHHQFETWVVDELYCYMALKCFIMPVYWRLLWSNTSAPSVTTFIIPLYNYHSCFRFVQVSSEQNTSWLMAGWVSVTSQYWVYQL